MLSRGEPEERNNADLNPRHRTASYFFLTGSLGAKGFDDVAVREMPPAGGAGVLDCFGFFASLLLRS